MKHIATFIGLGLLALPLVNIMSAQADCTPPPAGLVAWWKGEGNANDTIGTNNGIVDGTLGFANGKVGQAFQFTTTNADVKIPASASVDVGANDGFTLESWICPSNVVYQPLFEWNDGAGDWGVHFYIGAAGSGTLFANIVDSGGNWHQIFSPGDMVLTNVFQHVALTYDKAFGVATIYLNGVVVAQETLGSFNPLTSYDLYLGRRVSDPSSDRFTFSGLMDEPSIYSRALSSNEIAAIYNAGSAGKCALSPECTPPPTGLISWWPGEGSAQDIAGTNNGSAQNISYTNGQVGQAFVFDGSSSYVQFPATPSLDVGQGSGLTVEAWINPANLNLQALFEWNQNNGVPYGAEQIGTHLEINESSGDGSIWGNLVDTSGVSHNFNSSTGIIVTNQFQHIAMTYDKASGAAVLYYNGAMVGTNNFGIIVPQTSFDLFLGNRPSGFFAGDYFQGEMDEPSVYNRALSANEIAAIYNAGSAGKCQSVAAITQQPSNQTTGTGSGVTLTVGMGGIGPFTYQWRFNGTNISGATNATLTLTNLHSNQSGHYSVVITTPDGTLTSSNAVITVIPQDILAYNYSGKEQITTAGQEFSYNYFGQMFFIPASTNGAFVGWATLNGKKQYWISPLANYLWITIPGKMNHVYTLLGQAGSGIDENGYPYLWSYLHRGLNTSLTIATKRKFSFPNSFDCNDTHAYPDTQTGKIILREASSNYNFASGNTQTANNTGQTLADLVNALTKSLEKQGYQKQ